MSSSNIKIWNGGVTYQGPDATRLFQAKVLRTGLELRIRGIRLSHATPTKMLMLASQFSGKTYKRGAYKDAVEDLKQWIVAMEAALPIERDDDV